MSNKYDSINKSLFKRVPTNANRILDVGCDTGLMGEALKDRNANCYVVGLEMNSVTANVAKSRLNEVYVLDIENDNLDILEGNYDAIIFGDVLEHLYDPEACLRRLCPLLSNSGRIYACIPNIQHYTILQSILRGDFQYQKLGLLDRTHIRFYTLTNMLKMFLDSGYIPKKTGRLINDSNPFSDSMGEVIKQFNFSKLNIENVNTFQFFIEAAPMLPITESVDTVPMTFVVCCNDNSVLGSNLKASPLFQNAKHQLIVKRNVSSAAEGYNQGFDEAIHNTIVFVHQDVYFPEGWDQRIAVQIQQIEQQGNEAWIYGCIGYRPTRSGGREAKGLVIDRDATLIHASNTKSYEVQTLDELAIVMPKKSKVRFDQNLGFHFYGADICLQNSESGGVNYAGYSPCVHNSQLYKAEFPKEFYDIAKKFSNKWRQLPIVTTSCKKFVSS